MDIRLHGLALAVCLAFFASADVVYLKNGDRLTGTVKSLSEKKMTFASSLAGTVTIKMENVQTFSAESPIVVMPPRGTNYSCTVCASLKDGFVAIDGADVPFDDILKINPSVVKWTGKVTVGADLIRGNTHTSTGTFGFDASRRSRDWRLSTLGNYYWSETENVSTHVKSTTQNNWALKGQADWFFTEKNYVYASEKGERDFVADLDRRVSSGIGYGRQWFEKDNFNLSTEGGLSFISERYENADDNRDYAAARWAYHVDWTVLTKVKLYHNFEWIPSFENGGRSLVNADAGFQAPLTDKLAFNAKAQLAYNSSPADLAYTTDLRYIFGLSYLF